MLAIDMGVNILRADLEFLCQLGLQTNGIQYGTGTNDVLSRDAGNFVEHISHHIHRIGHDDINGIGGILHNVGRNLLQNIDVGLRQLQTRLAGLPRHTGGDNHDGGANRILVMAWPDDCGRGKSRALVDIHCLAKGFLLVNINQKDLRCNVHSHQVVCNGRTDAACAHNGDFCTHDICSFQPLFDVFFR